MTGTEQMALYIADISATKLSDREIFQLLCWGWNSSAFRVSVAKIRAAPDGWPVYVDPSVQMIAVMGGWGKELPQRVYDSRIGIVTPEKVACEVEEADLRTVAA